MLARAAALVLGGARASQPGALLQAARGLAAAAPPPPAAAKASSSGASSSTDIKLPEAPLKLSGTSASIATLVWQIAAKEKVLEKVQDELFQMVECFATLPELRHVALDPFVPTSTKVKLLESLFKGSEATEVTKRLFASLAAENCLAATLQVANAFEELQLAHKKEVHCTIITAARLDKLEKAEMRKRAEAFVDPGFKLVMKEKMDRRLLGGFVLEFEDRRVDMSVAKKLEEFNGLVFKLEADLRA